MFDVFVTLGHQANAPILPPVSPSRCPLSSRRCPLSQVSPILPPVSRPYLRCADWEAAISALKVLNSTASNPCGSPTQGGLAYPVPRIAVSVWMGEIK